MKHVWLTVTALIFGLYTQSSHADEFNFRTTFANAIKSSDDQNLLTQFEQRIPKFLDFDIPATENIANVFAKFKRTIIAIPQTLQRDTPLDRNSAHDVFVWAQPLYRYVKDSVWKSILVHVNLADEVRRIPAQNLPESSLNKLLSFSDENTVSQALDLNSNRQDLNDEHKNILVKNYIDKIKDKLNVNNFQELITQKLGASFLRYLPLDFLLKNPIFDDVSVIRNVATWLNMLTPLQRDALSTKVYRALTDATGKTTQGGGPLRFSTNDPTTLDMIARTLPSLSPRQIINAVGDKIVPLLERSSIREDQSCTTALGLLNRTLEAKRTTQRNIRPNPQMVQHWQECYGGCDLRDLFTQANELKELLKNHPNPEGCQSLIDEVKKEYRLERGVTIDKLRETSDVLGTIYRPDEINNLSNDLMAELGRDEKTLEKLGSQDLTPHEARTILSKIPVSTQKLWGKNMLVKLGNLIPGLDNGILAEILTRGRGDLPALFNNRSAGFIRKLIPSKIRLLIDRYATEPNLQKYRQLLASTYARKYISDGTLRQILERAPDTLRLIRLAPAQAAGAIVNRLGGNRGFDGSLASLLTISTFVNGLTKNDVERIKPEESLQAVQQIFGGARNRNIDNQMQSNTRFAFGNLLRRGLQTSEATQRSEDYVKGLFREDNLVDDLNPQLFATMTNTELDAINRLNRDEADRFWKAIGSIREPACCSFVSENRLRLADYALRHYGSSTGELDNFKLSQLGPFLTSSLRASDIRRITTDTLINKLNDFKSVCFQPTQAEAQALGARLNDAIAEVDDNLKAIYLDLIGELAAYLPTNVAAPRRILAQRTSFLSKSLDKLQAREEQCKVPDTDGFLSKSVRGTKRTLASAFLDQIHSFNNPRQRRQSNRGNVTCRDLRPMGAAVSGLSKEQLTSIPDDQLFQCIGIFGAQNDYDLERTFPIAQKYLKSLQNQNRHIQSLSHWELSELGSILTGFTPSELLQLESRHFQDNNFLAFIGNLDGWNVEQLKTLARLSVGNEQRLSPGLIENGGKILCGVDEQILRRISPDDIKNYLAVLANVECPLGSNANYSSTMFDVVKTTYPNDLLRPHIFGSLGTIAAGLRTSDLGSLTPDLLNFLPPQALARLPKDVVKSFTVDQLQGFNVEQIRSIPSQVFNALDSKQIRVLNSILYPFKTSGAIVQHPAPMLIMWILPLISIMFIHQFY